MAHARQAVRQYSLPYLLLAPSLLTIAIIALYPSLETIWTSLHRASLILPGSTFIGFGNFGRSARRRQILERLEKHHLLHDRHRRVRNRARFRHRPGAEPRFRGRGWVRAAVLVPWAIPTVVSSRLWGLIFDTNVGIANYC